MVSIGVRRIVGPLNLSRPKAGRGEGGLGIQLACPFVTLRLKCVVNSHGVRLLRYIRKLCGGRPRV